MKNSFSNKFVLFVTICFVTIVTAGLFAAGLVADRLHPNDSEKERAKAEAANLVISEICSKNDTVITDEQGKRSDWIELYNGGTDINLRGFTISVDNAVSQPFDDLPIAHGEYKLIFLDKSKIGFSLSGSGGEILTLHNRDDSVVAQVKTAPLQGDQVMSWNGADYDLTMEATPGYPNTVEGRQAFLYGIPDTDPKIVISEIFVSNTTVLPDENGCFSDLVELHNVTDEEIALSRYWLSDHADHRHRYALPDDTIPAGGYLIVFCDGLDYAADTGELHANFGLSEGESIILTSPEDKYTAATVLACAEDRSLILNEEGNYTEDTPSPGFPNTAEGIASFAASRLDDDAPLVISEVLLRKDGVSYCGSITDVVEICNRSDKTVSAASWFLSDKDDPYRYALPDKTLAPGECMIIFCDKNAGENHTGFALSSTDALRLTGPNHKHGQILSCVPAGEGKSWQWIAATDDGESGYRAGDISLGQPNTAEGIAAYQKEALPATVRISEAMSSNSKYLRSSYGNACDWVELYNASAEEVSLNGWYLSDDEELLRKAALPSVSLKPGEYYVIFLTAKTEGLRDGYPVLPFGLSSSGDRLYLSDESGVVDQVLIPALEPDISYGRPVGSDGFTILAKPTPGAENSAGAQTTAPPIAETPQGVYNETDSLDVVLKGDGTIYYTTDCSEPTVASTEYNGPIHITKTTVIRAICCHPGEKSSKVVDLTYILGENHQIAVASLVTEPENLWDYYTGIYANGPGYDRSEFPHEYANFWQQWEKEATVSLFEKDGGGFSEPCGIRIFGAYSRALPMKSFSCFFRGSYGTKSLHYPIFGDEGLDSYEAFIFRNTGQDFAKARMRDPLLTQIASDYLNMPVQKNRPVVLYLNGEFWGVYYIREKINENYVAGNFNVTKDEVTLTRANGTDSKEYRALISYVRSHDMNVQEYYDYVCSQVDIDNYIDYIIAQIYICNTDNGNIKFFKTRDGKWKWIMYDVDQSFRTAYIDTVADHLNPAGTGSRDRFSTTLINALLKRPEFKDKFLKRFAYQMNNVWTPEIINGYIDRYAETIRPEMTRDCEKWNHKVKDWEAQVKSVREFANTRSSYVLIHIMKKFGLSNEQMRSYGFEL